MNYLKTESYDHLLDVLTLKTVGLRVQIHRYCLKIYPKICYTIILRQKL